MKRLPVKCVCGKAFTIDHAMQCVNGGFIHKRHDKIRDIVAKLLNEVAYDVRIEPPLEPLTGEQLPDTANGDLEARLDVAARGFWQDGAMAFFDVRVFNPFAKAYINKKLETVFDSNEKQKKTQYNERVISIEHGSFTPIVLSAYGGAGRETERFFSMLISKISIKRDIPSSVIANYIRTKMSFSLVRSQVLCVRGNRKLWRQNVDAGEAEVVQCLGQIKED